MSPLTGDSMKILAINALARASVMPLLLFPLLAAAQAVSVDKPYVPKLARVEYAAVMLITDVCTKLDYPRSSARNEEEGTTIIESRVDRNGVPLTTAITRSSGFRELDRAAIKGAANCKFRPAIIDGKPVQGLGPAAFVWKLE